MRHELKRILVCVTGLGLLGALVYFAPLGDGSCLAAAVGLGVLAVVMEATR